MAGNLLSLWNSRWFRAGFAVLFSIALLVFLISKVNFNDLLLYVKQANQTPLWIAMAINVLFPIFGALRWEAALALCGLHIPYKKNFSIMMVAWPLACLTPGKVGDLVRVWAFPQKNKKLSVLVSLLIERLCDLVILSSFLVLGWLWVFPDLRVLSLILLFVFIAGVWALNHWGSKPFKKRFLKKHKLLAGALDHLSWASAAKVFWPSLLVWLLSVAQWQCCIAAFGIDTNFLDSLLKVPPALLAGMMPLAWMGMGTRDSAFLFVYHGQFPAEKILAASFVFTTLRYLAPGIIGFPWVYAFLKNLDLRGKKKK